MVQNGTCFSESSPGLDGKAHVLVEKGRLKEVDPGAGRLLGLLSLQSLPRRLTLDFSDLFTQGFSFDRLEGNFVFDDSDVYTTDTMIVGPAARVDISGRSGLKAQDFDQLVTVYPEVSSALPVAGALLAGPGVGAAMFLVERMARVAGGPIHQVARFKYRVTGSWDDPQIDVLETPSRDDDTAEDADFGSE